MSANVSNSQVLEQPAIASPEEQSLPDLLADLVGTIDSYAEPFCHSLEAGQRHELQ